MKKRVLVVEDDQALVEMYKEKLRLEGFRVITATDGRKALYKLQKGGVDIILLDILMPGLNGFEVLKKLKDIKEAKDIPVLVLTNIGSQSIDRDKKLAFSLGATDYLIKALNTPDEIIQKIRAIIG